MELVDKVKSGISLTFDETKTVFNDMLDGKMEESAVEQVLIHLAEKGETKEEIAGAAYAMRDHAVPFEHDFMGLLDTCGTGGDGKGSFNISTATAIVSSLFVPVAKHGNRAISSKSGSADVLEALGVPVALDPEASLAFLKDKNFVFLFAQKFFPSMRFVTGARKKIGKRTIFNLLGPLCNPARPSSQLLGIFSRDVMAVYMGAIEILNIPNVVLVSSHDGFDEISLSSPTTCYHKKGMWVKQFEFDPKEFGIYAEIETLKGADAATNGQLMKETLQGEHPDLVNVVAINTAFALMAAEVEPDLRAAFTLAKETMTSKKAYNRLMELAS